jgi:hypothetical protein
LIQYHKGQAMTDSYNDSQPRSSRDRNPQNASQTSGSREESMKDSGNDDFGKTKKGDTSKNQSDGVKRDPDLDPASSGTTPLGGESREANDRPGPGGVEGESGNS